jgi:type VI secretion system protein ImpK
MSAADDPFASADTGRTFILPTPGRQPAPARAGNGAAASPAVGPAGDLAGDDPGADSGLNPLVALANPLLAVIPQIRATSHQADPAALKERLSRALRDFDAKGRSAGIEQQRLLAARYILCTALDEAAAGTPWGGGGQWAKQNLLVSFHNEAYGGEKVFQLMAKLAEQPQANRDLLELIYAVLALGFEGQFKLQGGGAAQLEAVRARLAQILAKERGDYARPLAQHWLPTMRKRRPYLSWLPLWVTAASVGVLLLGLYLAFAHRLAATSDPTFAKVQGLRSVEQVPLPVPVAQPAPPRLASLLKPDIDAGTITVKDLRDRSIVTLRGDGLFASGGTAIARDRVALLQRVGAAAATVGGRVLVTGHTDNQPIRSARFPSNWHLSNERAEVVRALLVDSGLHPEVVRAEGKGESEPVASNQDPAGRSANRRVDVTVAVSGATLAAAPAKAPAAAPGTK